MIKFTDLTTNDVNDYLTRSKSSYSDFIANLQNGKQILFENAEGWINYKVDDRRFIIYSVYIRPKSKYDRKQVFEDIKKMVHENDCKCIEFFTKRNPKAWERAYGCKPIGYLMLLEV